MKLAEVHERFPALRALHGKSRNAFEMCLFRTIGHARGKPGRSGIDNEYEIEHVRVAALRILIHRILPVVSVPLDALRGAEWSDGEAAIDLGGGWLIVKIPVEVWAEVQPS